MSKSLRLSFLFLLLISLFILGGCDDEPALTTASNTASTQSTPASNPSSAVQVQPSTTPQTSAPTAPPTVPATPSLAAIQPTGNLPATATPSADGTYHTAKVDNRIVTTWTGTLAQGMPEYIVTTRSVEEHHENYPYRLEFLTIEDKQSGEIIFEDWDDPDYTEWTNAERIASDMELMVVDINFDGYKDILFLAYTGDGGSRWFQAYLFDAESGSFYVDSDFEYYIVNPIVDEQRKAILSHFQELDISYFDSYKSWEVWRYIDGELICEAELVEAVEDDGDGEYTWWYDERNINDEVEQFYVETDQGETPPAEAAAFYASGSYWDLQNPIWYKWVD